MAQFQSASGRKKVSILIRKRIYLKKIKSKHWKYFCIALNPNSHLPYLRQGKISIKNHCYTDINLIKGSQHTSHHDFHHHHQHITTTSPSPPPTHHHQQHITTTWCRSQPTGSMCCGSNGQIHTDYRHPVEKKGRHGHSLSERGREGQREPDPCLDKLLLLFWAHYIEDGPHLLCTGSL